MHFSEQAMMLFPGQEPQQTNPPYTKIITLIFG